MGAHWFVAVLLALCCASTQGVMMTTTNKMGYDNYQPAMMLSTLPSLFNTQLRQKFMSPTGNGVGNVWPFVTNSNNFGNGYGLDSALPSAQWNAEKQAFVSPPIAPHQLGGGRQHSMSLKRFFQSTNFPLSGTFMPLDLLHVRHYTLWNPTGFNPYAAAAASARNAGLVDSFAQNFGADPNSFRRY
eukprot:c173_g1_i1.p1 GENE.c173_g1_i1~~c173_g1_i1.p1  ORF type:complete len:194 (-),score=46.99 c173_g1_i1:128-685(-)